MNTITSNLDDIKLFLNMSLTFLNYKNVILLPKSFSCCEIKQNDQDKVLGSPYNVTRGVWARCKCFKLDNWEGVVNGSLVDF